LKIDQTPGSALPIRLTPKQAPATTAAAGGADRTRPEGVAGAQVHRLPGAVDGDFDAARVAAIREDIRAGRYQFHPERIADGLLASVRDLLEVAKKS
jgi:negative regulator of flagellin synthesis FlgM